MTGVTGVTVLRITGGSIAGADGEEEHGESYKFYTAKVKLFIRFTSF